MEVSKVENGNVYILSPNTVPNIAHFLVTRSSETPQATISPDENGVFVVPITCGNGGRNRVFTEAVNRETGELVQGEELFVGDLAEYFLSKPKPAVEKKKAVEDNQ